MLDGSIQVLLLVTLTGFATVAVFVWAWWTGKLDDLEAQATCILDARDLRLDRPWESVDERSARAAQFGELLSPEPGEWGDGGR